MAATLKEACEALATLVTSSNDPRDWPVLHMPPHANTFPLAYVYSCLLLIRTGKLSTDTAPVITDPNQPPKAPDWAATYAKAVSGDDLKKIKERFPDILKEKIRTKEWGDDPPKLERKARFNIFFANKEQTNLWGGLETFHSSKIFDYKHKFFLADKSEPASNCEEWVKKYIDVSTHIRIVTDIPAQANLLRNDILTDLAKLGRRCENVTIVPSSSRTPSDVLQWTFVDGPSKRIKRVFLFGTPLCRILSEKYTSVIYTRPVPTYLCVQASDPSEGWLPVLPIYQFFERLGYKIASSKSKEGLNISVFDDIAENFHRCLETKLPTIGKNSFSECFRTSISEHCFLVKQDDLFRQDI